jgi:class 3 adenylate cyclase
MMDFYAVLDQIRDLLQRRRRVTYRALKVQFQLDDEHLEALTEELIDAEGVATDEQGKVLVWTGGAGAPMQPAPPTPASAAQEDQPLQAAASSAASTTSEAERRQLTVLFCDLADSTRLARHLDPEDLRDVIRAYQTTCVAVIQRFAGHVAQYLGDGLLVYFGYPQAHEDDAQRAVRTGLGMLEAMETLNIRLARDQGVRLTVRVGIHTGLVVVGEMGSGGRHEHLALGDTPNLAARLQGLAEPDTVVVSAATFRLVRGYFTTQELGAHSIKGITAPMQVYRMLGESAAQSRLDIAGPSGLTPLVGRDSEVGLLLERWAQSQDGWGQVVLLSGEAGIGKSRLVEVLKDQVAAEPQAWLTPCQCSPYYQNTALYPAIDLLERVALRFEREESPPQKLSKLEGFLVQYGLPLAALCRPPLSAADG